VYLPIWQLPLQELDDTPTVCHGLDFGGCAQIAQERAAFLGGLQGSQGRVQIALSERFLPGSDVAMAFHGVPM
jgi:hypothetical protein